MRCLDASWRVKARGDKHDLIADIISSAKRGVLSETRYVF
jgi:hypothetical protein